MNKPVTLNARLVATLLISASIVSGCSSSGSGADSSEAANASNGVAEIESAPTAADPAAPSTTRVAFDITVPAYQSNELQVRLVWADKELTAEWVRDESWQVADDFPVDTENPLLVEFNDKNGAITLGSVETPFRTGTNASALYRITADQFDTGRWDSDGNGTSNLDELIAGLDPLVNAPKDPVDVSLELVADKTVRLTWQASEEAQFYRVLENTDGVSGYQPISDDLDAPALAFNHRVALYQRVNARYIVQACNAGGCVDSDAAPVTGSLEGAIGYLKASNAGSFDHFGGVRTSNAISLSADGTTLVVGAPDEDSAATGINGDEGDDSAVNAGAAYVFARIDGRWQQQAYIKASNTDTYDRFGMSVSLSADGNTLAVGADNEDGASTGINGNQEDVPYVRNPPPPGLGSGAVYVFTRSDGNWQQQAYVKGSYLRSNNEFGNAVTLSDDGNTLAVAAQRDYSAASGVNADPSDIANSGSTTGAVYVFIRTGETWQQQAYVKASNPEQYDWFGGSISLSADGDTLAVGAHGEGSAIPGINGNQFDDSLDYAGAVYVFSRSDGNWQQQAYVKASNPGGGDEFGQSVSLSGDGNTLAVGASGEGSSATGVDGNQRDNTARLSGAVYVFTRQTDSWQQQAYIKASNPDEVDSFGSNVSLSADAATLAVTSIWEDSAATGINGDQSDNSVETAGAAYVFTQRDGVWQQQAYIKASNTGEEDRFGASLDLSADGSTLAVGAVYERSATSGINGDQSDNSIRESGAVYLY